MTNVRNVKVTKGCVRKGVIGKAKRVGIQWGTMRRDVVLYVLFSWPNGYKRVEFSPSKAVVELESYSSIVPPYKLNKVINKEPLNRRIQ